MESTTRFQLTSQTLLLAYLVGSVHKLEPPRDERIGGICSPVGATSSGDDGVDTDGDVFNNDSSGSITQYFNILPPFRVRIPLSSRVQYFSSLNPAQLRSVQYFRAQICILNYII